MCNVINDQSKATEAAKTGTGSQMLDPKVKSHGSRTTQSSSTGKNQNASNSTGKITNFSHMNSTAGSAKHMTIKASQVGVPSSAESKKQ